jgi:O-acetyl-ADP-ribose deacetylase (regulator of RNase III)
VASNGPVPTGFAAVTSPGRLAQYKCIIHAVGPIWTNGRCNETEYLKLCVQQSLQLAEEQKCVSIAFPAISSGVFGYPKPKCAVDFFAVIH